MKPAIFFILWTFICSACEVKVNTPNKADSKTQKNDAKIRNGILLNEKGLKVEQAYLTNEDGSIISNENKFDINQKVILNMMMAGWKVENGRVYIGAIEKISTSEGHTILDTEDLFIPYPDGVSAKDAKIITLSAVLTKLDKPYDYILVEFRVWDKKGGGEVTGSYKLYLN